MQCRGYYPAPRGPPRTSRASNTPARSTPSGRAWRAALQVGRPGLRDRRRRGTGRVPRDARADGRADPRPNLDFEQAAADARGVHHRARRARSPAGLRPGETVLIHAVGSGVGTAAVQVAKAMGCVVFGTSRTAEKLARAAALGLDVGIESPVEDFAEVVLTRRPAARGVNVIIDLIGAPALEGNMKALADRRPDRRRRPARRRHGHGRPLGPAAEACDGRRHDAPGPAVRGEDRGGAERSPTGSSPGSSGG